MALTYFTGETEKANATVSLGQYTIYRDIAIDIKNGMNDRAKCRAELGASSMVDTVRLCAANRDCRQAIEKEAREVATEVLGQSPLPFDYIQSKNGIKRCPDSTQRK